MQAIVLVDNGSKRPAAFLNLRRLAAQLGKKAGMPIDAVPLQHANKIPPGAFGHALDGQPVVTLKEYVEEALKKGLDELVIVPLFFGHSRAISSFIPETLNTLQKAHGRFDVSIADVLCPLPQGEPILARLLYQNLQSLHELPSVKFDFIILVDHGSPYRKVTDVRVKIAAQLADCLPEGNGLLQASMEKRAGPEYDFCGPLLADLLDELAQENDRLNIAVSMLFLSPGRHAGEGGDIAGICDQAMQDHPGLKVQISPLVGDNPLLIDILLDRLRATL